MPVVFSNPQSPLRGKETMDPISSVPGSMTIPIYGVREGITYTYPNGSQYFIWYLKRGFSSVLQVA